MLRMTGIFVIAGLTRNLVAFNEIPHQLGMTVISQRLSVSRVNQAMGNMP